MTDVDLDALASIAGRSVEEALKALPEDEQRAYLEAQRSVVEARRSAERVEGQIMIGGS